MSIKYLCYILIISPKKLNVILTCCSWTPWKYSSIYCNIDNKVNSELITKFIREVAHVQSAITAVKNQGMHLNRCNKLQAVILRHNVACINLNTSTHTEQQCGWWVTSPYSCASLFVALGYMWLLNGNPAISTSLEERSSFCSDCCAQGLSQISECNLCFCRVQK